MTQGTLLSRAVTPSPREDAASPREDAASPRPREHLVELLRPDGCALLTVECQRGVVGPDSALPELAAVAQESGALGRVAQLVAAAHDTGVQVQIGRAHV